MIDGGWTFVRDAGPMIVAATILVWAAAYFPRADQNSLPQHLAGDREVIEQFERQGSVEPDQRQAVLIAEAENRLNAYQLEQSFLGRAGRLIEPVVRPLGWDWRIASAVLASFPAREVVVSTMGVIFGLGDDANEESESLRESLRAARRGDNGEPLFTIPVALSLMVLFALCAQCVSTLAVIRRETNSYGWPVFTFVYMTLLAYFAAWATFQVSRLFV
jgi:ferrous iron transport protein B